MSNVFAEFLVNQGLYDKIEITEGNINALCDLIDGKEKVLMNIELDVMDCPL